MLRTIELCTILVLHLIHLASAAPSFSPILPPAFPLAVRNPYLSTWVSGKAATDLPTAIPKFLAGQDLAWAVNVRIDGQVYNLMGVPTPAKGVKAATMLGGSYTGTRSIFELDCDGTKVDMEFFSPVSPKNFMRQSLPFSYLTVTVTPEEGGTPDVQVYSDIGSWTGAGPEWPKQYSLKDTSGGNVNLEWTLNSPIEYAETGDMANWGQVIYSMKTMNTTSQIGSPADVRAFFQENGSLNGTLDPWSPSAITGFAHNMGPINKATNLTFSVGLVRKAAVNYLGKPQAPYYMSELNTTEDAVDYFHADYNAALTEAKALETAISEKAVAIAGQNYSDILLLSLQQTFAATEITVDAETLSKDSALIFLKEISSNGNMNTIDVIFPAFPALYVLAPEYIRLLLEPTMRYLKAGRWTHPWMIHDLGTHYPNATGHDDGEAEQMPIEECGNVILFAYMYGRATGSDYMVREYGDLLKQYADYLIEKGLYPEYQFATDDGHGQGANYTNLAIKAAVALNAYGLLTRQKNYSTTGLNFASQIFERGLGLDKNRTHFTVFYGNDSSWNTPFNLFADTLFKMNTFPREAIDMENAWYPTVHKEYGVQLDSRALWGKTDWMMHAAATALAGSNGEAVRDMFVDDIHYFLTDGVGNELPFNDRYFVDTGKPGPAGSPFRARPVVGGHFSLMALEGADLFKEILRTGG